MPEKLEDIVTRVEAAADAMETDIRPDLVRACIRDVAQALRILGQCMSVIVDQSLKDTDNGNPSGVLDSTEEKA